MELLDSSNDTQPLTKPCIACRKRKVKCSKTRPCSNCARARQLCQYDGDEPVPDSTRPSIEGSSSTDSEVRERLARLEKLMEMMMMKESGGSASSDPGSGAAVAKDALSHLSYRASNSPSQSRSPQSNVPPVSEISRAPIGQILFKESHSAYFDSDFWAGLITEVEDLRQLFDPPLEQTSPSWASSSMLGLPPIPSQDSSYTTPSLDESNLLCKLFFETVNPFIRVLHQAHFGRELDRYRRGRLEWPAEFEALLSSIYLVTINSLRPEIVQRAFLTPKATLVSRYQHTCQVALTKVDFFKTSRIHALQALLHYLTFLIQQNLYQDATALLGVAARLAQTLGHHRDPSHFPFSPWVRELRRRVWNHLSCLDGMALSFYGAESCLPPTSDTQPPQNANESEWHASRFANPSSVPESVGFTDMTFVLVHRVIAETTRKLAGVDPLDFEEREKILRHAEVEIERSYTCDMNDPEHMIVAAYTGIRLSSLRLSNQYRQLQKSSQTFAEGRHQVFTAALTHVEALDQHIATFSPSNKEWIFSTIVPWLALAILLTYLPHTTIEPGEIERATWQISLNFERFSNPDNPVSGSPMWRLLVQLREQMQGVDVGKSGVVPTTLLEGDAAMMSFVPDVLLDEGLYGTADEAFLYEDQFMLDLPWLNTQMPY